MQKGNVVKLVAFCEAWNNLVQAQCTHSGLAEGCRARDRKMYALRPEARFSRVPKTFRACKASFNYICSTDLDHPLLLYLKNKICMKGNFVRINNM